MRVISFLLLLSASVFSQQFDILIRNGHIVDGTGSPWYSADIGIRGGRLASIGHLVDAKAGKTIDARGMVVAPGFIDMLGQSEATILVNPHVPSNSRRPSPTVLILKSGGHSDNGFCWLRSPEGHWEIDDSSLPFREKLLHLMR